MPTLRDYYRDLLVWEGTAAQELVADWPTDLVALIQNDFKTAVKASDVKKHSCFIKPGSSNQSIGHQVEIFIVTNLVPHLRKIQLLPCKGAGYPDRKIIAKNITIACEMKATSDWNPLDSNRRVLTSSTEKLRAQFEAPIFHLLCTAMYAYEENSAKIGCVRLDFLEPSSPVSVRLEASVSHKLLTNGTHASLII